MSYKRLTETKKINEYCSTVECGEHCEDCYVGKLYDRLAGLEDKIEQGTLVFKKKPKKKYYAIVGYRNYCGKFGWHIHYVSIEYEKEYNRVALNIDGRLFTTKKDLLFNTEAEAKAKLKELSND